MENLLYDLLKSLFWLRARYIAGGASLEPLFGELQIEFRLGARLLFDWNRSFAYARD